MDATIETKSVAIFWPAPFPLLMLMQSSHSANLTAFKSMNHLLSCITIESPSFPIFQRRSESSVLHWPRPRSRKPEPKYCGTLPAIAPQMLSLPAWMNGPHRLRTGREARETQTQALQPKTKLCQPPGPYLPFLEFLYYTCFTVLSEVTCKLTHSLYNCSGASRSLESRAVIMSSLLIDVANDLKPRLTFMPDHPLPDA